MSAPDRPGDGDASGENGGRKRGHRKDGRPFKDGNTRPDGSYEVGKGRTPEGGKFRKNDGRDRGKRQKGSKNVATIWERSLRRKHTINGITQTSLEWLVESTIRRGITKSDRAAEKSLEAAERFERAADPKLGLTDQEILAWWLQHKMSEIEGSISDDSDQPGDGEADEPDDGGADDSDNPPADGDDYGDQ